MLDHLIVQYGAPTLAGIKTGSIFNVPYESETSLLEDIRDVNRRFTKSSLRIFLIRFIRNRAVLYLVRLNMLAKDIRASEAESLLCERGYNPEKTAECISRLFHRMKTEEEFPHELGLFLGYPPEDVRGFIENRPCIFTGAWRVYGNEKQARKTFSAFRKCTGELENSYCRGVPLEMLAA